MDKPLWRFDTYARHRSRHRLWCFLTFLAVALASAAPLPGATFTATLDRNTIAVGETATLLLKFEDGQPQTFPSAPVIPNVHVSEQGTSQNFSLVNGQMMRTVSRSYGLTPVQPGEYTIPAFSADVGGQTLSTRPMTLKVLLRDPTAPTDVADQLAFLWLVLPKKQLFLGEAIVAELRLYVRNGVANVSDIQLPMLAGDGFNAGSYVQGQQYQRRIGNVPFTVVPLLVPLTPVKTGDLSIGPVTGSVVVHLPRDGAGDPFGFFGNQTVPRRVPLVVQAQPISVLPLPSDQVPPDFAGAVGRFTLDVDAGPTNLPVGDPITVKVQISGEGRLDALALPTHAWDGFKVYPPSSRVETQDQLGLRGTKFFEQIVVPQNADIAALPPIRFSFFDPERGTYQTLTRPALPLTIRSGEATPAPAIAAGSRASTDDSSPASDILPIRQRLGPVAQIEPPLVRQPWFVALQTVPVIALFGAVAWRKRTDALANNPRIRRRRRVAQVVRRGLTELRLAAAENKPDEFFAVLFRILQEQVGETLDVPASAVTESVVDERLRPAGVPEPTLVALRELFQSCNLARYAPVQTAQELEALIPKTEGVLRELQERKP